MHEPAALEVSTLVQSLLQGVQHKAGVSGPGHPPAHDAPGVARTAPRASITKATQTKPAQVRPSRPKGGHDEKASQTEVAT